MTKTILLGITIAAVFAIGFAVFADAITGLANTDIKQNSNGFQKITFSLVEDAKIAGEDFGGYAIFTTGGDVIAVTSHQGAFDSEAQGSPGGTFVLCSPAQVASGLCGPEWHTHLVKPVGSALCSIAAVGSLTFEEPSKNVNVKDSDIAISNVKKGTSSFTNSVSGSALAFTVGASQVSPNPVTGVGDGVPFDLVPVFDNGNLLAICIGPAA